ncbi:MAG: LytTR family DNA-binding domain-containing protein [Chitinophagaceae bacterium]
MTILIIDNEQPIREGLKLLLKNIEPESKVYEAEGVMSGLKQITIVQPQIVFLDVEMDDGTGFDLMKQIPHPNFQLIFITAHNKYAVDAFKLSALDYLLKPVEPLELFNSLEKAKQQITNEQLKVQIQILLHQVNNIQSQDRKIVLKDAENTYFYNIKDILYCEANGTYTKFYFEHNDPILVSKNLREYENLLHDEYFARSHHSYLVNIRKIKSYDKKDGGMLILENNTKIPVSHRKKDKIMQLLEQSNA